MDYTLETARRLAEELRAIPAKDPSQRRLDKQAMVKELARELIALQQRGYTIEEVAESLRGRGLEITTPTLKNYLQRAKSTAAKRAGNLGGRRVARGAPTSVGASARCQPPAAKAAAEPSSNAAASAAKARVGAAAGERPNAPQRQERIPRQGQGQLLTERTEACRTQSFSSVEARAAWASRSCRWPFSTSCTRTASGHSSSRRTRRSRTSSRRTRKQ